MSLLPVGRALHPARAAPGATASHQDAANGSRAGGLCSAWLTEPWCSTSRLHHEVRWGLLCSQAASSNSKQGKAWGRGLEGSEWGNVTHPAHSSAQCMEEKPDTAAPTEMESSGTARTGIAPKARAWPPAQCWAPASLGQPLWHSVWHRCAKRLHGKISLKEASWRRLVHKEDVRQQEMVQVFLFPTQEEAQRVREPHHLFHLSSAWQGAAAPTSSTLAGHRDQLPKRPQESCKELSFLEER